MQKLSSKSAKAGQDETVDEDGQPAKKRRSYGSTVPSIQQSTSSIITYLQEKTQGQYNLEKEKLALEKKTIGHGGG